MPQRPKQLRDIARAMRLHVRHRKLEYGSVADLEAYQEEQLKRVVRNAVMHSAFLGRLYKEIDVEGGFRFQGTSMCHMAMPPQEPQSILQFLQKGPSKRHLV